MSPLELWGSAAESYTSLASG